MVSMDLRFAKEIPALLASCAQLKNFEVKVIQISSFHRAEHLWRERKCHPEQGERSNDFCGARRSAVATSAEFVTNGRAYREVNGGSTEPTGDVIFRLTQGIVEQLSSIARDAPHGFILPECARAEFIFAGYGEQLGQLFYTLAA